MTIGVGGSEPTPEFQAKLSMRSDAHHISNKERETRIEKAQEFMRQQGIAALYLDTSTSLSYYTGLRAEGKERLHGEVIPADGPLSYIYPHSRSKKQQPPSLCGAKYVGGTNTVSDLMCKSERIP